jgi:CDP-diacylglycerol--glycerol-3-phosphate 3-phosphatidyltransferase
MGKFMDPIADKILVSSILIMLITKQRVDPYMVLVLLARDTFIGGIRAVAAAENIIIDARAAGKWKTALQMGAIPVLIYGHDLKSLPAMQPAYWILWLTVVLSVISGVDYYQGYRRARAPK